MEETANDLLENLRAACAAQPQDPQAAARLAEHYTDLGWFNEALDVYREALMKNPDDFFLLAGYANTCYRHRDIGKALTVFKKLTALRPERIEGWNNAGIAHMNLGNITEAKTAFKKVLEIEPDNAGALLNLGNCCAKQGAQAEAQSLFERAIAVKPDYADAWLNLGNSYLAEQKYTNAKSAFGKSLRYQREFPSALKNLGFACEQLREWEKAADCYRQAAKLDKTDAEVQINLANVYCAQDDLEGAKNCFLMAVKLAPRNTAGWLGLRHCALLKGDVPTYLRATNAVLAHLDGATVARSVEVLLALGHPEEARAIIEGADSCRITGDELDAQRLVVYERYGIHRQGQADIYKRLNSPPATSYAVRRALTRYDLTTGNYGGARQRAAALPENDAAAQELLVRSLVAMGKKEEAGALLLRALHERPLNGGLLLLRARLAAEEGADAEAKQALTAALEIGASAAEEINGHVGLKLIFDLLMEIPENSAHGSTGSP